MPDPMTPPTPSQPASEEAGRLGAELRAARTALGASLEDTAATLRIRPAYLAALEEGRIGDLPAPAYAIGFLRAYARALGLDEAEAARRFREAGGEAATARPDLVFPEPLASRRTPLPVPALVLAGVVLALVVLAGWYGLPGGGGADPAPALPVRSGGPGGEAAPPVAAGPPAPQQHGQGGGIAPARPPSVSFTPAPASPPPAGGAEPAPAPAALPERMLLRARDADVWIQVREGPGGPVLADRVLGPGESWEVPSRPGLVLSTGNARQLEVMLGDEALGLGSGGAVRRNIPLREDGLRALASGAAGP